MGRKIKRNPTLKLKQELDEVMRDLNKVREEIENLSDCPRQLQIMFDEKSSPDKRANLTQDIMMKCGMITKAVDNGQIVQGRFAAMLLGEDHAKGIGLMFFSREFAELEMEAVKIRARILAIQNNVKIESMKEVELPPGMVEPNTDLVKIGTSHDWNDVTAKAKRLFDTGCITYFAGAHPSEIGRGKYYATSPLYPEMFNVLPELLNVNFGKAEKIDLYINEFYDLEDKIVKGLTAIPINDDDEKVDVGFKPVMH